MWAPMGTSSWPHGFYPIGKVVARQSVAGTPLREVLGIISFLITSISAVFDMEDLIV